MSENAVEVRWRDNSTKETGFGVDRSTNGPGGPFYRRATTDSNVTRYTDSGLAAGAPYCYRIAAVSHSGTSAFSNAACAITPAQPGAPSNATAMPQKSSVVAIAWSDNSTNEDGFRLERAPGAAGPWEAVGNTARDVTTLQDIGRVPELQVCYRVLAFNARGDSQPSNVTCATPPAAPRALVASSVDASTIALAWIDASAVASGYELQRAFDPSGPFGAVATLPANATRYIDAGLASNTTYWYRVRAIANGGFSDFSNAAFAVPSSRPAAPTDLRATFFTNTNLYLSWTDASSNEDGFRMEGATTATGPWDRVWIFPASSSGFSYEGVPTEQSCYRIFAFNAQGDSAPSNIACATTMAAPTSLTATAVELEAIELTWKDNSALEDGYEVNRSIPSTGPWSVIADLPANTTSYRDTDIVPDTSYVYYVRAKRGSTFSDWSNLVRATVASKTPEPPTLAAAPNGSTAIWVTWSLPGGADGQRLERSTDDGTTWTAVSIPGGQDWTAMLDEGRTSEQRVCYRAFSINSFGESSPSSMACTIPPAFPCALDATVGPVGIVNLSWTDCSAIETGYVVSRMLSFQDDWSMTFALAPNTTSVADWPGQLDVYAIYQVVTTVADGQSDPVVIWVYVPPQ